MAAVWPLRTPRAGAAAGVWGPVHSQVADPGASVSWSLAFPPDTAPPTLSARTERWCVPGIPPASPSASRRHPSPHRPALAAALRAGGNDSQSSVFLMLLSGSSVRIYL